MKHIYDFNVLFQEESESKTNISFKTSNMDAFIAYIDNPSDTFEVVPEGCTYTNQQNSDIRIQFAPDTVETHVKLKVKVGMFYF